MGKTLFFLLLCIISIDILAQTEAKREIIKTNNITSAFAYLDMVSDDPQFENIEVQSFEYDEEGRNIKAKYVYPFYDVVTTSDEYLTTYDNNENIITKIHIHRNEPLTKRDRKFIAALGETNDTTITHFDFDSSDKVLKKVEFKLTYKDTLIAEYEYDDSLLIKSTHYDIQDRGSLDSENYTVEYSYDDLGRLSKEKKTPETLDSYSITEYKYLKDSKKIIQKVTYNDFKWFGTYKDGGIGVGVSQDSVKNKATVYEYDENENLIKETFYLSFPNLETDFYGGKYKYADDRLIEQQSFKKFTDVINLTDKIEYLHDSKGLLIEKRMIYNEKLEYTYKFKYE